MTAGGIVFRVVTPNHPGEPSLDDPSAPVQIRTEFFCYGEPCWTNDLEKAYIFPRYLDAVNEAKAMGPRFHARLVSSGATEFLSETSPVSPTEEPARPPPRPRPVKKLRKSRQKKAPPPRPVEDLRSAYQRVGGRQSRDWVTDTYG